MSNHWCIVRVPVFSIGLSVLAQTLESSGPPSDPHSHEGTISGIRLRAGLRQIGRVLSGLLPATYPHRRISTPARKKAPRAGDPGASVRNVARSLREVRPKGLTCIRPAERDWFFVGCCGLFARADRKWFRRALTIQEERDQSGSPGPRLVSNRARCRPFRGFASLFRLPRPCGLG